MSSRPARPLTSASHPVGTVPEEPLILSPPLSPPPVVPSDSGAPLMPSQQGQTLPSFPPGGSCLCLRACLPPSFSFAPCHFCQAGPKPEAALAGPQDDCEGGSSLSEEEGVPPPAPCTTVPTRVQVVSSQVSNALFSLSCLIPCWQLRSGHGGM